MNRQPDRYDIAAYILIGILLAIPVIAAWWWALAGMRPEVGGACVITWFVILVGFLILCAASPDTPRR